MSADAALSGDPIVPIGLAAEPAAASPQSVVPLPVESHAGSKPQAFDFRTPSLLTINQMRKLRLRHDDFVRSLATRLSIHLRLDIGVQILDVETAFYFRLIERLANPTHAALFRIESLEGVGLVEVPPKTRMGLVDRLLGGLGKPITLDRDLSEIETALLDQLIALLLQEWCQAVAGIHDPKPAILGHETNPRFIQIASNDSSVLIVSLDFRLHDCAEKLHLAFPFPMLQPLIRQLNPPLEPKNEIAAAPLPPLKWNHELDAVKVPLSAEWVGLEMDARQLAHLKVGDVLPVESDSINHTAVHLASVPKFTGRLGKCGNAWAIELLERI